MDVVVWLRSLGLGKYEAAFRENEIDETVLPNLMGGPEGPPPPQAPSCHRGS
jgi:SAM domain (Sterile alpha motif)